MSNQLAGYVVQPDFLALALSGLYGQESKRFDALTSLIESNIAAAADLLDVAKGFVYPALHGRPSSELLDLLKCTETVRAVVEIIPGQETAIVMYTPLKVFETYDPTQREFLNTYRRLTAAIANATDAQIREDRGHVKCVAYGRVNPGGIDLESVVSKVDGNVLADMGVKFLFYQAVQMVHQGSDSPTLDSTPAVVAAAEVIIDHPIVTRSAKPLLPCFVESGDSTYMSIARLLRGVGIKSTGNHLELVDQAQAGRDPLMAGYVRAAILYAVKHQDVQRDTVVAKVRVFLSTLSIHVEEMDVLSALKDLRKRNILRGQGNEFSVDSKWIVPLSRMDQL